MGIAKRLSPIFYDYLIVILIVLTAFEYSLDAAAVIEILYFPFLIPFFNVTFPDLLTEIYFFAFLGYCLIAYFNLHFPKTFALIENVDFLFFNDLA